MWKRMPRASLGVCALALFAAQPACGGEEMPIGGGDGGVQFFDLDGGAHPLELREGLALGRNFALIGHDSRAALTIVRHGRHGKTTTVQLDLASPSGARLRARSDGDLVLEHVRLDVPDRQASALAPHETQVGDLTIALWGTASETRWWPHAVRARGHLHARVQGWARPEHHGAERFDVTTLPPLAAALALDRRLDRPDELVIRARIPDRFWSAKDVELRDLRIDLVARDDRNGDALPDAQID